MDDNRTVISPQRSGPRPTVGPGTRLNGIYEVEKLVAAGGMGEVYRGRAIETGAAVAIKMIKPELAENEAIVALFRKEASALNNLHHEAIVRYYVFTVEPVLGIPYLAMEFVDGVSLADMIRRGPMRVEDVDVLRKRVAAGLNAAHDVGIIHRDISPDNIILPAGRVDRAKIIDFGIARSTQLGEGTLIGSGFAGKYNYVSPEQLGLYGGDVTGRSDIYSFGLVLTEALAGRALDMGGTQLQIVEKRRAVPELSGIDERLRPLIEHMLEPDPADRIESMAAVAAWSAGAGHGAPMWDEPRRENPRSSATPAQEVQRHVGQRLPARQDDDKGARRFPLVPVLGGVAAVLVLGGAGAMFGPQIAGMIAGDGGPKTVEIPVLNNPNGPGPNTVGNLVTDPPSSGPGAGRPGGEAPKTAEAGTTEPAKILEPEKTTEPAKTAESPKSNDAPKVTEVPKQAELTAATSGAGADPSAGRPGDPSGPKTTTEPKGVDPKTTERPKIPVTQANDRPATTVPTTPLARITNYIVTYDGGPCFYLSPLDITERSARIEGFGAIPQPFITFDGDFKRSQGFEANISLRQVTREQCPLVDFMRQLGEGLDRSLKMTISSFDLRAGEQLKGKIEGLAGRHLELFLVADDGFAYNLGAYLKQDGKQAEFAFKADSINNHTAQPEILLAVASRRPLEALAGNRPVLAEELFPKVLAESRRSGEPIGISPKYYTLK